MDLFRMIVADQYCPEGDWQPHLRVSDSGIIWGVSAWPMEASLYEDSPATYYFGPGDGLAGPVEASREQHEGFSVIILRRPALEIVQTSKAMAGVAAASV